MYIYNVLYCMINTEGIYHCNTYNTMHKKKRSSGSPAKPPTLRPHEETNWHEIARLDIAEWDHADALDITGNPKEHPSLLTQEQAIGSVRKDRVQAALSRLGMNMSDTYDPPQGFFAGMPFERD